MTFLERYQREETWYGKVMIMEIYHLTMLHKVKGWTITLTARDFEVSTGLVSENLRIANAFHDNPALINSKSRVDALRRLNNESTRKTR